MNAFHAALSRGDTAGAAALLAPDVLIYESGRAERSKADYAAHHLPADANFAKATRRNVTRRSGRVGMETVILKRTRSMWRIIHIHRFSANAK